MNTNNDILEIVLPFLHNMIYHDIKLCDTISVVNKRFYEMFKDMVIIKVLYDWIKGDNSFYFFYIDTINVSVKCFRFIINNRIYFDLLTKTEKHRVEFVIKNGSVLVSVSSKNYTFDDNGAIIRKGRRIKIYNRTFDNIKSFSQLKILFQSLKLDKL